MLIAGNGRSAEQTYVEDVFSTYLYTGNGSTQTINNGINLVGNQTAPALDVKTKFATTLYTGNGTTQTITNGIDLAGQGGLVWIKSRSDADSHSLFDNLHGITKFLASNLTNGLMTGANNVIDQYNSNGFQVNQGSGLINQNTKTYVSWTFRKAPRFFDVVTWTGSGTTGRQIPHSLGVVPGMVIIKATNQIQNWYVQHRSIPASATNNLLYLNDNGGTVSSSVFSDNSTSTNYVLGNAGLDAIGYTYVAYLFAHDTAADSLIQCGSFTTNGSGAATVTLGWKPQWCMVKCSTQGSSDWQIRDTTRGWGPGNDARLFANTSGAETSSDQGEPTATGFTVSGMELSQTYIYVAIRTDQEYDGSSGGMVWSKSRSNAQPAQIINTVTGIGTYLVPSSAGTTFTDPDGITAFTQNGYTIGNDFDWNYTGYTYVNWTFRKQAKFFDIVTYTGNGVAGRTVAHNLGSVPGCIIVKATSGVSQDWQVYHRSIGNTKALLFNNTASEQTSSLYWNNTTPTSTEFTLGTTTTVNGNGTSYVAYLFAHDAGGFGASGSDNVISCGSYVGDGGAGTTSITLGYEPQWLLVKDSTGTDNWAVIDNMRGFANESNTANDARLIPNTSDAESFIGALDPTSTGFKTTLYTNLNTSGRTYIYIAIRRGPMKTPTTGTSVFVTGYNSTATSGSGVNFLGLGYDINSNSSTSFDSIWSRSGLSNGATYSTTVDRLRGIVSPSGISPFLITSATDAERSNTLNSASVYAQANTAILAISGTAGTGVIAWAFRRAPGFFDEVCWIAGSSTNRRISHNLGAVPELIIVKRRDAAGEGWLTYTASGGRSAVISLNTAGPQISSTNAWGTSDPTNSDFGINEVYAAVSGGNYVSYLFATCPGVSKVGSYTGNGGTVNNNGTSQTINCGFTTSARFVLIKRTDSTGDWYTFDNTRGIVAASDPYLLLNSTAAEVTSVDAVDPDNSGFIVNQTSGTNLNVTGASYIFLAIA